MKKSWIGVVVAACAALALAACATIKDAPAGPYTVASGYTVTLGRQWSDISAFAVMPKNVRLLTIDGPLLNRLYISDGLAPGGFLIKSATRDARTPTYRADMAPTDLIEFLVDNVTAYGYQRVESANPRAAQFAGGDALRVDVTAKTAEGLDMSGTALLAERNGKLYVILYLAPSEHYYGATLPEVEKVMASVTVG